MSAVTDIHGHLTDAGFAALRNATPGQAPAALAAHLSGCSRCQERALAGGRAQDPERTKKVPPPPWRIYVVVAAILVALLSILYTLQRFQ